MPTCALSRVRRRAQVVVDVFWQRISRPYALCNLFGYMLFIALLMLSAVERTQTPISSLADSRDPLYIERGIRARLAHEEFNDSPPKYLHDIDDLARLGC